MWKTSLLSQTHYATCDHVCRLVPDNVSVVDLTEGNHDHDNTESQDGGGKTDSGKQAVARATQVTQTVAKASRTQARTSACTYTRARAPLNTHSRVCTGAHPCVLTHSHTYTSFNITTGRRPPAVGKVSRVRLYLWGNSGWKSDQSINR